MATWITTVLAIYFLNLIKFNSAQLTPPLFALSLDWEYICFTAQKLAHLAMLAIPEQLYADGLTVVELP